MISEKTVVSAAYRIDRRNVGRKTGSNAFA
jgi:hypothetical protein